METTVEQKYPLPSSAPPSELFFHILDQHSPEMYLLFYVMSCFVNPVLSLLGVIFNILSLILLTRSGLNKPPRILLFGLVVSDIMTLTLTLNYAAILSYFGPDKVDPTLTGYQYNDCLNYFLVASNLLFHFLSFWGNTVSSVLTVVITTERILAVFLPMRFKTIVTAGRTRACVIFCYILWLPWSLFFIAVTQVVEIKLSPGVTGLMMSQIQFYWDNREVIYYFEFYVLESIKSWIPAIYVFIGCHLLLVKIKLATVRRKNLTITNYQKVARSHKTTKILLTTCLIFGFTQGFASALAFLLSPPGNSVELRVRNQFIYLMSVCRNSCNFFLYVFTDRKLRDLFVDMNRSSQRRLFRWVGKLSSRV